MQVERSILIGRVLGLVCLLDGAGTVAELQNRLEAKTANQIRSSDATLTAAFDRLRRTGMVERELIHGRGIVWALTATGRERALAHCRALLALLGPCAASPT
jgi:hypothetical protein